MGTPAFVDIHVHPDLKSFLSSNDEIDRKDCWQDLSIPFIGRIIDDLFLGNILESQSSLTQLNQPGGPIVTAGLYGFERAMIKGDLFNSLLIHVDLLTIAKVLEIIGYRGRLLDYKLLKRMSKLRTSMFRLFNEAHSHLLLSDLIPPGIKLLKSIGDYDPGKLNIILTAEGGHNLFRKRCSCHKRKNVIANIDKLKAGEYRFLFAGPAHIERSRLCTHAYAIKFLHHKNFLPVGYGITNLGKKAIKELLGNPNRILIDIKHMSLESRKQFYNMLDEDYPNETIPVIASHVGVTGISYDKIEYESCETYKCKWTKVQHTSKDGIIPGTKFYPWSINLYDEEIKRIIQSEGLIGLSLDARILGARQKKDEDLIEYFSKKEFRCGEHGRHPISQISNLVQGPVTPSEEDEFEEKIKPIREKIITYLEAVFKNPERYKEFDDLRETIEKEYKLLPDRRQMIRNMQNTDLKHLCNNILHIVRVGGDKAWKHICIGSDFDGLVCAIKCCKNVTEYGNLALKLKRMLPEMAASATPPQQINNIDQKVDGIMAGNAHDFLKKYFV